MLVSDWMSIYSIAVKIVTVNVLQNNYYLALMFPSSFYDPLVYLETYLVMQYIALYVSNHKRRCINHPCKHIVLVTCDCYQVKTGITMT